MVTDDSFDEPMELVTLREYNQLIKRNAALRNAATIFMRALDGETVTEQDLNWARAMLKARVGEEGEYAG